MMFMNHSEITEAVLYASVNGDANLVRATRVLGNLRDLADIVSDGWCYWPKLCKAARQLQTIIRDARRGVPITNAALKKALSPIRAFLTREAKSLQGKTLDI